MIDAQIFIWKDKTGGELYYVGVFIFNGMSGVLLKLYEGAAYPKVSSAGYSLWIAVMSVVISAAVLIAIFKKVKRPNFKAVLYIVAGGALNRIANFLLYICSCCASCISAVSVPHGRRYYSFYRYSGVDQAETL